MLGWTYGTAIVDRTGLTTWPQSVFAPSTGVAGNLLTPGIYIVTIYAFIFFSGVTTSTSAFTAGIARNVSTNPVGFDDINNVSVGVGGSNIQTGTYAYWPTFVFTVPSTAYYYTYVTSSSGSMNAGTYGIGVRTTSMTRIG